jgi:hypothetical protein
VGSGTQSVLESVLAPRRAARWPNGVRLYALEQSGRPRGPARVARSCLRQRFGENAAGARRRVAEEATHRERELYPRPLPRQIGQRAAVSALGFHAAVVRRFGGHEIDNFCEKSVEGTGRPNTD